MINTTEQMGGALGIAVLTAILLGYYWDKVTSKIEQVTPGGRPPTDEEIQQGRDFILEVEEKGREHVQATGKIKLVLDDIVNVHADAYAITFFAAAFLALLGALACFILVRKGDRVEQGPVFRRSRWLYMTTGRSPAITKRPDPAAR